MTKSPDLLYDLRPQILSHDLAYDLNHLTYYVILQLSRLRQ